MRKMEEKTDADIIAEDGYQYLSPSDYCNYIARMHYEKRNKGNPLWNHHLIGGMDKEGKKFLGVVDLYGNTFEGNHLVTGMAHYFCNVLLANAWHENITEAEAKKLLEDCFRVLFYRDKSMSDKIQFTVVTKDGVKIEEPYTFDSEWNFEDFKMKTNEITRDMRYYF